MQVGVVYKQTLKCAIQPVVDYKVFITLNLDGECYNLTAILELIRGYLEAPI